MGLAAIGVLANRLALADGFLARPFIAGTERDRIKRDGFCSGTDQGVPGGQAMVRLGAKEEGTLRRHLITWTGRVRDTVYFSILDTEWAQMKARLEARLAEKPKTP